MRKLLPYLLAVMMVVCLAWSVSAAENVIACAVGGYENIRADVFEPKGSGNRLFDIGVGEWSLEGDSWVRERNRKLDGRICMMCEQPENAPGENEYLGRTAFVLELDEYAGNHDAILFGIFVDGSGTSAAVDIGVTAAAEEITAKVYVTTGEWNLVSVDARFLESRISEMRVTVEYDEDTPRSIIMTKPYMTRSLPIGLVCGERLASNKWTVVSGIAMIKTGWISPDETRRAEITAPLITSIRRYAGTTVYFEIRLAGALSGNMTLGILYAGAREEQREYQRKISLNASDGVYTVPVRADAEIVSYSLQFDNLTCDGPGMTVEAIRVYGEGKVPITGNADLGRVETIVREGSSVVFSGTVERNAAADFRDSGIHFYAIPGWCADDLSCAVDLGKIKMTTRFRYTADLASMGAGSAADTFRFFVGLTAGDEIIPLSHPRYPDAASISISSVSNMGMYGTEPVGVFESNASNVMVEVPLDRLILSKGGEQIPYALLGTEPGSGKFRYGGTKTFSLNESLLRELDAEIDFYISAGIHVYLRLTASAPVPGLTYTGKTAVNYAVHAETGEARQMYAALIRTLCGRWSDISGIALGRGVNYSVLVGDHALDSTVLYASDLAEVCRITYNAASSSVPDALVIVPYVEYMTDETDESSWIADRTMAVMLADKLDEMGTIPWVLMYCVDSTEDELTSPVTLRRMLTELELDYPAALMVFWQPDPDEITYDFIKYRRESGNTEIFLSQYIAMRFGQLCESCSEFRARAVFLSMVNLPAGADYTFYEHLKNESAGDSGRFVFEREAQNTRILAMHEAVLSLWDFRESHHTMGWIAGGGVSSCITDYSRLFAGSFADTKDARKYVRVLRARVDGHSGITLCNFDETLDLTGIDGMDFTVAVEGIHKSSADSTATLVFVIGTEDTRAEYTVEDIPYNEIRSFHCDFSEYEYLDRIDYVGVMVYADGEVYLDISEIHVHSAALSKEQISDIFNGVETTVPDDANVRRMTVILCAVAVVLSAAAVVAITRHEKETEENGGREKPYEGR